MNTKTLDRDQATNLQIAVVRHDVQSRARTSSSFKVIRCDVFVRPQGSSVRAWLDISSESPFYRLLRGGIKAKELVDD